MNEIGLFLSTFGGGGMFIWYLLNDRKTMQKDIVLVLNKVVDSNTTMGQAIDDLTLSINSLLDYVMPSHSNTRQTKDLTARIDERRRERQQQEVIQKFGGERA
jgi:hypothetical protein